MIMFRWLKAAGSSQLLLFTIVFLVVTCLAVLLNIPLLRQFSSFIFLTFVPGYLILLSLKLNRLGVVEKVVLSVGLSVAFLMLFGLLVNYLCLAVGYTRPLSTVPLLISFGITTLGLAAIAGIRNKDVTFAFRNPELSIREKLLLVIPSLFPLLSIGGMRVMNTTDNNALIMLLLLLIPAYVIFISFYHSKVPERLYPAFIYLIGVSLVLLWALRGNHLSGSDVLESYYVFQVTLVQGHWKVTEPSLINSLLSVSLLPSIYQVLMKTNPEYLFKLLFPVLFSISPLIVYTLVRKYIGSFYAFLAAFLFMSQFSFLWTTAMSQTNLAIMFFALAIMVHFHSELDEFAGRLFFLVFAISSVVSHYSTSYIFFFMLLATWSGMQVMNWIHARMQRRSLPSDSAGSEANFHEPSLRTGVSMTIILLFFVIIFLWHAQITKYAFDTAVGLISRTLGSMHQSFLAEVKGPEIAGAFGQYALTTIPQKIRFYFDWLVVIFIAVGGLSVALRYKNAVAYPGSRHPKPNHLESKFDLEYFVLSAVCGAILVISVVLPYISEAYSMERTYFQSLIILASCFPICGMIIAKWMRIKPYLILLPVLIPFFLSITGVTYQLFHIPASLVLNSAGTEYEHLYIADEEGYAAKWLAVNEMGGTIYTDYGLGPRILASQGRITRLRVRGELAKDYRRGDNIVGYIYLFYPRVVRGEAPLPSYAQMDIIPLPDLLASRNRLYTNEAVEIYR